MRWRFPLTLLAVWLLVSASNCQLNVRGPTTNVELSGAAAGVGIGLFLVTGTIVCLSDTERCFLDEEAVRAKAEIGRQIQARFTSGLRRTQAGDAAGPEDICVAAYLGSPQAQYFYAVSLVRRDQGANAEALRWLESAARQGHRAADILLRQLGGWPAVRDAALSNRLVDGPPKETDADPASDADEELTPEEAVAAAAAEAEAICARESGQMARAADQPS